MQLWPKMESPWIKTLFSLMMALSSVPLPLWASEARVSFTSCQDLVSSPLMDLTPYINPIDMEGQPLSKDKWHMGRGGEGTVTRMKTPDGEMRVEKTFDTSFLASMNAQLFQRLRQFQIKSFKVLESKGRKDFRTEIFPWVKGISLIQILENPKVPQATKEQIWGVYENKLAQLAEELSTQNPDLFFEIHHFTYFKVIAKQVSPRPNLEFIEMNPLNLSGVESRITFRQRFMIHIFESLDENAEPFLLEPKPDNILIDPKTWEMTWIDPN